VAETKNAMSGLLTAVEGIATSESVTKVLRPLISRTNSNLVFSKAAGKNALPSRIQSEQGSGYSRGAKGNDGLSDV
jgi:hypothetical protein